MEIPFARTPARAAVGVFAFILGVLITVAAGRGLLRLYDSLYSGGTPGRVVAWELLCLGIPLLGGWIVARAALHRWGKTARPMSPRVTWARRATVAACVLLLAGYAATWVFGVPAVITELTAKDIDAYKSALQSSRLDRPKVSGPYPMMRTFVAIPVAPGIVVVYQEMQVAGLCSCARRVVSPA